MTVLLLLVLGLLGVDSQRRHCDLEETRQMQRQFSSCSRQFSSNPDLSSCQIVESIVETCSEQWRQCHSDSEIRRRKELHLEALVRQYRLEGNRECRVVAEYRQSGRTTADRDNEIVCTDTKTLHITKQLQNCSHEISTRVYENTLELTRPQEITEKLCTALTDIANICIIQLKECFAPEDVKQMKKSSLEEMKEFLIRIVNGKVGRDALDNCRAGLEEVKTETPVVVTEKPQEVTNKPQEVTEKPEEVTEKSQEVTEMPQEVTELLQEVTEKPQEVTELIQEMTEKPPEETEKPQEVKELQQDVTEKPQEVTEKLVEGTEKPQNVTESRRTLKKNLWMRQKI